MSTHGLYRDRKIYSERIELAERRLMDSLLGSWQRIRIIRKLSTDKRELADINAEIKRLSRNKPPESL
mgnify:CR=1 FL=1